MVRIKERYLLVNIVYPPVSAKEKSATLPLPVVQHQPTIEKLTPQALLKGIRAEVSTLFGDFGAGALEGGLSGESIYRLISASSSANPASAVKYLSLATSTFILRCGRSHYQMLWAALTVMDRVPVKDGRPCTFRVVRVSGTIRKAEEEAIRQARSLILSAKEGSVQASGFLSVASEKDGDSIMKNVVDHFEEMDTDGEDG